MPEFDPYKYDSFATNAADVVHRLTRTVDDRIAAHGERDLQEIPGEWLLRMRYNPFYDVLEDHVLKWMESAAQ